MKGTKKDNQGRRRVSGAHSLQHIFQAWQRVENFRQQLLWTVCFAVNVLLKSGCTDIRCGSSHKNQQHHHHAALPPLGLSCICATQALTNQQCTCSSLTATCYFCTAACFRSHVHIRQLVGRLVCVTQFRFPSLHKPY